MPSQPRPTTPEARGADSRREPLRLAVIGDVHGHWLDADTEYFNASPYAAVLFVGDLALMAGAIPTARRLAGLRVPAWAIAGNHDATTTAQFLAELQGRERLAALLGRTQGLREARLRRALGAVKLAGFSLDTLDWHGRPLGILAARPFSMGGERLYFRAYLQRRHGVASIGDSARRLRALIDAAPPDLVLLAHNGPAGLGGSRSDPWGCDFRPEQGDFGDPDLRDALDYALDRGRRVHAVLAGHMHHQLKGGGERTWQVRRDGVLYVNAARVPRIAVGADGPRRHHVELILDGVDARAQAVWIDPHGRRCTVDD